MTNHPNADAENPREQDEDSSSESATPPPPPEETQDDDVGLATEMLFSGHQREQLRNAPDYETLETGGLSWEDEDRYQDVAPSEGEHDTAHTELNITSDQSDARDAAQATAAKNAHVPSAPDQQSFGNYQAQSFDPHQQHTQTAGTTNEPLALAMFIILTLAALGLFGALLWLIYRLVTGA